MLELDFHRNQEEICSKKSLFCNDFSERVVQTNSERARGSGTYKSGGVGSIMLSAPRNHLAVMRRETADLRPSLVAALISILNAALYLPTILCWTLIHSRAALLISTQANDSLVKAAIFLFSLTGCAHVWNFARLLLVHSLLPQQGQL